MGKASSLKKISVPKFRRKTIVTPAMMNPTFRPTEKIADNQDMIRRALDIMAIYTDQSNLPIHLGKIYDKKRSKSLSITMDNSLANSLRLHNEVKQMRVTNAKKEGDLDSVVSATSSSHSSPTHGS